MKRKTILLFYFIFIYMSAEREGIQLLLQIFTIYEIVVCLYSNFLAYLLLL
jgi:hypothetical protein